MALRARGFGEEVNSQPPPPTAPWSAAAGFHLLRTTALWAAGLDLTVASPRSSGRCATERRVQQKVEDHVLVHP